MKTTEVQLPTRFVMSVASRLLRLGLTLLVLSSLLAVAVSALGRPAGKASQAKASATRRPLIWVRNVSGGADFFLDAEGARVPVAAPAGLVVHRASWSPPRDGQTEVVGVLRPEAGRSGQVLLARIAQPSGEVLDQIPTQDLPNWWAPPCWYPDGSDRVLLSGADGQLIRIAFVGDGETPPRATALTWDIGPSGRGPLEIGDLSWPTDSALGGRILAAFINRDEPAGRDNPEKLRTVWSVKLDPSLETVVDAAPIIRRAAGAPIAVEERFPVVSPAGSGALRLAWLERAPGSGSAPWRLRTGPVEFDAEADGGAPFVRAERAITLAEDAAAVAPAFGDDGAWVAYVPEPARPAPRVRRVALGPPASPVDRPAPTP